MTVEFTPRNHAIAAYLVHGHTPWGHQLDKPGGAFLGEHAEGWVMCCGHVLTDAEARAWVAAGIVTYAPPLVEGRGRRLVASPSRIAQWLNDCWDAIGGDYQYPKAGEA